jgi:hypothetical protein
MTVAEMSDWQLHDDGSHISVRIAYGDAAEVRHWCAENCMGDYVISLGRCVLFQRRQDAALATLWWRRSEG